MTNLGDFDPGEVRRVPVGQEAHALHLIASGDFIRVDRDGQAITGEDLVADDALAALNLTGR